MRSGFNKSNNPMFGSKKTSPTHSSSQGAVSKQDLVALYRQALQAGASLEKFDQRVERLVARQRSSTVVEADIDHTRRQRWRAQLPAVVRAVALVIPVTLLGVGLYMLGTALLPIASHLIVTSPALAEQPIQAPIPNDQVIEVMPQVIAQANVTDTTRPVIEPTILDIELDYTNLSNWFEEPLPELSDPNQPTPESQLVYTIDIPKVDVEQAEVRIGGTDLNQSLIHYPGTANPGELGAPVIFGHSVLRQFYNPSLKNKNRYNSIFSYIMTLDPGDDIFVTYDGVRYRYQVTDKTEVKPEDVYILAQERTAKDIKLVTCTPEGTYLRRGVVTARLVE